MKTRTRISLRSSAVPIPAWRYVIPLTLLLLAGTIPGTVQAAGIPARDIKPTSGEMDAEDISGEYIGVPIAEPVEVAAPTTTTQPEIRENGNVKSWWILVPAVVLTVIIITTIYLLSRKNRRKRNSSDDPPV